MRTLTEAENEVDPLEEEILQLFPHLKQAQENRQVKPDMHQRQPGDIDKRNPTDRFRHHDTPDVSKPEGEDNPNLGFGGDSVGGGEWRRRWTRTLGYDPVKYNEDHDVAIRPAAQKVQVSSPSPDTELAGVVPEKLIQGSLKLYADHEPKWKDVEDPRGYEKVAVIDDKTISNWIDGLGFNEEAEATLRKAVFTNEYKNLLGSALVGWPECPATNFELLDSDLILYG